MFNQSNGWARRHGRGDVETRKLKSMCGGNSGSFQQALCMCQSHNLFVSLIYLVDYLAAWKLLPNVSQWVLHTVEKGYRIQFGCPPPCFNRVIPTLVGPKQALVMEQEINTLLKKEAIEVVPPHDKARQGKFIYIAHFIHSGNSKCFT